MSTGRAPSAEPAAPSDIWDALRPRLRAAGLGDRLTLDGAPARAHGMSNIVLFVADGSERRYVVRVQRADSPNGGSSPEVEARRMAAARSAGVPVPEVVLVDDGGVLGMPFMVTSFVAGAAARGRPPADADPAAASTRTSMMRETVEVLARIHRGPVLTADDRAGAASFARGLLDRWSGVLSEEAAHGRAVIDCSLVEAVLRETIPRPRPPALIHGDYRLANLLWRGPAISAVLDWEFSAPGDPLFDVAWMLMGTTAPDDLVMGWWTRRQVLQCYRSTSGDPIGDDELLWWELLAEWVRVSMQIAGLRANRQLPERDLRWFVWEFAHRPVTERMLGRARQLLVGAR